MEDISDVFVTEFIPTIYSTPGTLKYTQNNRNKSFDVFLERNGVIIILYNKTNDVLVLVKQFRASVYFQNIDECERLTLNRKIDVSKYPAHLAFSLEFCAGLDDKSLPPENLAQEEILEECGYKVPIESLERITNFCNLSETTGARTTLFYCEVTEDQRVHEGGGCSEENENIQVVEMKVADVIKYASQSYVCSPVNFLYCLNWFLYHKYNKI
ncbi:uridine diphosphate glucose pyrophosphatase NUDT14-like [Sitophilus oryzae]|uniref:Uridine diphosphate glucose pyrophosphatase NUDT14 n=1 Tax=Sitophilus oryzae TaxID=7048 RepID=A0A6J2XE46_SITOR|nr:uridine diphosphate glucose pyrophosphatase NUDT14-like [Sitophilus oryzae]